MSNYYNYRQKTKKPSQAQIEFVRQIINAPKNGKRLSIRLPKILEQFNPKSKLLIKLLAEHYSKEITPRSFWTEEELEEELEGI